MRIAKFLFLSFIIIITGCDDKVSNPIKLSDATKDYFNIQNGRNYNFSIVGDSAFTVTYTTSGYINNQVNQDIENSEIVSYDMNPQSGSYPYFTVRSEAGGTQFKDRVAVITKRNDSLFVGPVLFSLNGAFEAQPGTFDSIVQYPQYKVGNRMFDNVIKVRLQNNLLYNGMYFAKGFGIVGWETKNNTFYYLRDFTL